MEINFCRKVYFPRLRTALVFFALLTHFGEFPALYAQEKSVQVQFVDSETGYALQPEFRAKKNGRERVVSNGEINKAGRAALSMERGLHLINATSPKHRSLSGTLVADGSVNSIRILLDPIEPPPELNPENIISLHRDDATVIVGFIVDDESGVPLKNVSVSSEPNGVKTKSNARGFFQIVVPLQSQAEEESSPAKLLFEKTGFQTEERQYLELWPNGDWTYRIRLSRGAGRLVVDERQTRRRPSKGHAREISSELSTAQSEVVAEQQMEWTNDEPIAAADTVATNATVRIPRTIRVLQTNGTTIDYLSVESYVKHSLPHEWPATWGSFSGSLETFKAGSVACRSYAVARINNASLSATYDICATTSCQVYNPGSTYTATDNAINQTAGYVVVSGTSIASSEYSAENNSSGFSCGDGYTQPTGGCIFDPVCSGQVRSGHGRGMCQWGTLRWGTGLKYDGNWNGYPSNGNSGVTNGYPKTNWLWMVAHYYPTLRLVQATPLVVGDDVKATASVPVRMNADGSISNAVASGINCPLITTKVSGDIGVIITNVPNPVWVTNDGRGYTWYKIKWSDNTIGWSAENWLQRVIPTPPAPSGLTVTPISPTQINLSWIDNSVNELEFVIQRAFASGGPWTDVGTVASNITTYANTGLSPSTAYYYRITSYNLGGNSAASNVANTNTPGVAPTLAAISNKTVTQGNLLTFTNSATAPETVQSLTDFESFSSGASALFRVPNYSGSTSPYLDASPNTAQVTSTFPVGTNTGSRVFNASWSWNATANPWLRLTTASATALPNPVIDFTKSFRFSIYSDKNLQVAIGCRETTNAVGTPIGSDAGSGTAIEWAGATGKNGSAPISTRTVAANAWTNLTFNLPLEPILSFNLGDNVLSTASGLGAFEHIAFVPAGGIGTYNIYLDNFEVFTGKTLTFSLDPGAPTNATINSITGVFNWTPAAAQGLGNFNITVRVTDNSAPPQSDTKSFVVTVVAPPSLQKITNTNGTVTITWSATTGRTYRVQYKNNLEDANWIDLSDVTAVGSTASFGNTPGISQRFYRIVALN